MRFQVALDLLGVLQMDAIVRHALSKQTLEQETTKGTHNNRQLVNAGQQRYMSHKWQYPKQAAVKAST